MNTSQRSDPARRSARPVNPRFSSGPCKKHTGWTSDKFSDAHLGFSHRAPDHKAWINSAIQRSAALLGLPDDWRLGIVPASDTGAFEMAMWSLLGPRGVDALVWESFSADWANDIRTQLKLEDVRYLEADYGKLPDLNAVDDDRDVVFVFNGTTSGVRVPNLDWLSANRKGLAICDATSAAYAMPIDFSKVDVLTWSWQKVLGGEAGFGMLALGPRAVERLESYTPAWPMPKIFRLTKNGKLNEGIFKGATINTPSMLAVADLHLALDWAEAQGGLQSLHSRCDANYQVIDQWVEQNDWIEWLAEDPTTRSSTSMCLKIVHPDFLNLDDADQRAAVKAICATLAEEKVAFDIAAYRAAPPGLRIWGGATIEASDIGAALPWIKDTFFAWLKQDTMETAK